MKSLKPLGKKGRVRTEKELLEELQGVPTPVDAPTSNNSPEEDIYELTTLDKFIRVGPIKIYNSGGIICRDIASVEVSRFIEGDEDKNVILGTIQEANEYIFNNSISNIEIPSMPITCTTLLAIYEKIIRKQSDGTKEPLDYKPEMIFLLYGKYKMLQNTQIDWKKNEIVHYPLAFVQRFDPKAIEDFKSGEPILGEEIADQYVIKKYVLNEFLRDLTGLCDPVADLSKLSERYGGKGIVLKVPDTESITDKKKCGVSLAYHHDYKIDGSGRSREEGRLVIELYDLEQKVVGPYLFVKNIKGTR